MIFSPNSLIIYFASVDVKKFEVVVWNLTVFFKYICFYKSTSNDLIFKIKFKWPDFQN